MAEVQGPRRSPALIAPLLALGCLGIFLLTFYARNSSANSDPRLSLLVSLALIEEGTIRLDSYAGRTSPPLDSPQNRGLLARYNGHLYYNFPLGTSLAATPAVFAARLLGRDLTIVAEQNRIQNGLAALSCCLIFLLLYGLGRVYLAPGDSLFLALTTLLGSSLISTLGAALWSHHLAVVAAVLALWLLARWEQGWVAAGSPYALGGLLFVAYLARPSMALFAALILLVVLRRFPRRLPAVVLPLTLLLAGFLLFSRLEFGSWFPPYYRPQRLTDYAAVPLATAIYGQLFSPSRGLFVFSPFLLLLVPGLIVHRRRLQSRIWPWLVPAWLLLQLGLNSRAAPWWGGFSYGPRLLTDLWPGFFLLLVLVWAEERQAAERRAEERRAEERRAEERRAAERQATRIAAGRRRFAVAAFAILAALAIWIHTVQGLYNVQTNRWNGVLAPTVDDAPALALDWRYPQFLATAAGICRRQQDWSPVDRPDTALALGPGAVRRLGDDNSLWLGWAPPETDSGARWSECAGATVSFVLPEVPGRETWLFVAGQRLANPAVTVALNGQPIGALPAGTAATEPLATRLALPTGLLRPGLNELRFDVPGAGDPLPAPPFRRGIGLQSLAVTAGRAP